MTFVVMHETFFRYLTREFYAENYNISQRIDVLDVLIEAARELSSEEVVNALMQEKTSTYPIAHRNNCNICVNQ
jgi:hypothetical protein